MRARSFRIWFVGALVALAGPAAALDTTLQTFFSQRLEARKTTGGDDDGSVSGFSDFGVRYGIQTPTTRWLIAPGIRFSASSDESVDKTNLLPRLNGFVTRVSPRRSVSASLSIVPELDSEINRDEGFDVVEEDSLQLSTRFSLSASQQLDPLNSLNGSAFVRRRDAIEGDPSVDESTALGSSLGFVRALTPRITGNITTSARYFESSGDTDESSEVISLTTGATYQASPRLSFSGSAGLSYVSSKEETDGVTESNEDIGFVGSLSGQWRPDPKTSLFFSLSQDVDQNDSGRAQNQTSFRLGGSHQFTERASVSTSFGMRATSSLLGDGDDDVTPTFSLSPRYSIPITRDWSASLGYNFRLSEDEDDGDLRTEHRVFLQVSQRFSFLP